MLTAGIIPRTEPDIHVGIILPEDQETRILLTLPDHPAYRLHKGGAVMPLMSGSDMVFEVPPGRDGILLNGKKLSDDQEVRLQVDQGIQALKPGQGIRVEKVVAGRGFHWKKYIPVTLPGDVLIRRFNEQLILINVLPLEHYVMCVATSEMGSACPAALIEAQTITARSWILANIEQKHRHLNMDVCNDDCCQRYQGSTHLSEHSVAGALHTYGQVLLFDGKICDARYSKSCGGVMERFETIWGGEEHAYLQAKQDSESEMPEWSGPLDDEIHFKKWVQSVPKSFCSSLTIAEPELAKYLGNVDEMGTYFRWRVKQTQQALIDVLSENQGIQAEEIVQIKPLKRGPSGRLNKLEIVYTGSDGKHTTLRLNSEYDIRKSLHKKFLYSSAFVVSVENDRQGRPAFFEFKGAGWGHGVGLCQIGALGMSLQHYNTAQILQHYYPNSILEKIY